MSEWSTFRLLVVREFTATFRRRGMQAVMVVLFVGALAAVILPEVIGGGGRTTYDVGLAEGSDDPLAATLINAGERLDVDIDISSYSNGRDARRLVSDGDLAAAVIEGDQPQVLAPGDIPEALSGAIQSSLAATSSIEALGTAGIDPARARLLLTPPNVKFVAVGEDTSATAGVAALAATVMYLALLVVTMQAVNGTAAEKSDRVSEVLLTIARPRTMLLGKVIGVSLVALAGVAAIALPLVGKGIVGASLPVAVLPTLGLGLIWYSLGALLYALLGGTVGSLVERQEDAGTVAQPLILPLVAFFLVAQSAADSTLGVVLAYIPFSSPVVEPSRIALGVSSWPEMVTSAALLVATLLLTQRVAGNVYRRAIVQSGTRVRLRDALV